MPTKTKKARHVLHDDEFIANALVRLGLNGGNVRLTCRQLNVPQTTLLDWRDRRRPSPKRLGGIQAMASAEVKKLAEQLLTLSRSALGVAQAKVGELDAYRAALVGGISIDKLLALVSSSFLQPGTGDTSPLSGLSQERLDELERLLDAVVVEGEVIETSPAVVTQAPPPDGTPTLGECDETSDEFYTIRVGRRS